MKIYNRVCDGSAGMAIDNTRFLVANDETEILHLYRNDIGTGQPLAIFDFTKHLRDDPDNECDLEGVATIGDVAYWIGSHGRSKGGKRRPNRHRLFATQLTGAGTKINLQWAGRYDNLARDMCVIDNWATQDQQETKDIVAAIVNATRLSKKKKKKLAPKKHGLNIEGLAARRDGSELLIGLRNPVPSSRAVVIPLINPAALVSGSDTTARFGQPIQFDFDGHGIRSIGYVPAIRRYVIISGPIGNGGPFRLHRWSGSHGDTARFDQELDMGEAFSPEAIVSYGQSNRIQLLGDGGIHVNDGKACKDRKADQRYFSDRWHYLT